MSIRNFSKLLQRVFYMNQTPRQIPFRNFTSLNRDKQNENQKMSQQNVLNQMEEGAKRLSENFPTMNKDDTKQKDNGAGFKIFPEQSEAFNPLNFIEALQRKGNNPSKQDDQNDKQVNFGEKYNKENVDFENIDAADQKYDTDKFNRSGKQNDQNDKPQNFGRKYTQDDANFQKSDSADQKYESDKFRGMGDQKQPSRFEDSTKGYDRKKDDNVNKSRNGSSKQAEIERPSQANK